MRKFTALLIALVLALCACGAGLAEDAATGLQIVSCPEHGFSTLTAKSCDCYFNEVGMNIDIDSDGDPWLLIVRTDDPGSAFDVDGYFENVMTPQTEEMIEILEGELISYSGVQTYTVAGIEMRGGKYTYRDDEGATRGEFILFDLRDDGWVNYELYYDEQDKEDAEAVLIAAAYYYQPDPDYYG